MKAHYVKHIEHLKGVFAKFKEDWSELYKSRGSLIEDVKNLMMQLDVYRQVIIDLEAKVDLHNKSVDGTQINMKQNIDLLTRTSLSKKSIELKSNITNLLKSSEEIEALKTKVKRIEMNKFSGSQVLGSIAIDLQNIVSSEETTSIKESKIITSETFLQNIIK